MKKLFSLLLALCLMCGVVSAVAEEATQEVTMNGAKFRIPAEVKIEANLGNVLAANCENYILEIYAVDWKKEYDITCDDEPSIEQWLNVYLWYIAMGVDEDTSYQMANFYADQDIGMPDGKTAACLATEAEGVVLASVGHTNNNYGFLITLTSDTGMGSAELFEISKQVALSFQYDETAVAEVIEPEPTAVPTQYVVITGDSANIRTGPSTDYQKIHTGLKGDEFPYLGESGNWYMIDVNGQTGYVSMGLSDIK